MPYRASKLDSDVTLKDSSGYPMVHQQHSLPQGHSLARLWHPSLCHTVLLHTSGWQLPPSPPVAAAPEGFLVALGNAPDNLWYTSCMPWPQGTSPLLYSDCTRGFLGGFLGLPLTGLRYTSGTPVVHHCTHRCTRGLSGGSPGSAWTGAGRGSRGVRRGTRWPLCSEPTERAQRGSAVGQSPMLATVQRTNRTGMARVSCRPVTSCRRTSCKGGRARQCACARGGTALINGACGEGSGFRV